MTRTTDTAAAASIEAAARELKLPVVRTQAGQAAIDAERAKHTYLGFLAELLEAEVDSRAERRRQRRITEAKFPRLKRLIDFDLDAAPTVNPATIATLAAGNYLTTGDPVVLLGDSGTGKSHLLIGLGLAACEAGLRVRYVTTAQLTNELAEAADERRLARLVARYGRLDLLCLDELGYVHLDTRGSELLFQILTEREEKSSVAVASNLPFSEWGKVIPDARLVAAVIDRVTFNAHIIETGTESYRLRVTRQRRTGGAKSSEHPGANPG
jgi:DNA replication protein DnaC